MASMSAEVPVKQEKQHWPSAAAAEARPLTVASRARPLAGLDVRDTLAGLGALKPRHERYEILSSLACGQFGEVLIAVDTVLNRKVAIKAHVHGEAAARELLTYSVMAAYPHQNVAVLLDYFWHTDKQIVNKFRTVHELCDTDWWAMYKSLGGHVGLAERPWAEGMQGAAEGIGHIHRLGLVHGDVTLKNVLLKGGTAVVTDFGTAMSAHTLLGKDVSYHCRTFYAASPESLLSAERVWSATDVWSLGVCGLCLHFASCPWMAKAHNAEFETAALDCMLGSLCEAITEGTLPGHKEMQGWTEFAKSCSTQNAYRAKQPPAFSSWERLKTEFPMYRGSESPVVFRLLAAILQLCPAKRPSAGDIALGCAQILTKGDCDVIQTASAPMLQLGAAPMGQAASHGSESVAYVEQHGDRPAIGDGKPASRDTESQADGDGPTWGGERHPESCAVACACSANCGFPLCRAAARRNKLKRTSSDTVVERVAICTSFADMFRSLSSKPLCARCMCQCCSSPRNGLAKANRFCSRHRHLADGLITEEHFIAGFVFWGLSLLGGR